MRWVTVLLAAAGSAVIAVLVVHFGAGAVARSLAAVGISGVVMICAIHLMLMAMMGLAWWVLLPGSGPWPVIWARLVRDSVAEVLPFSQLGGYVFGARALAVAGVPGGAAVATTIVDVTQEFLAQIAYVAIALSWLVARNPRSSLALPGAIGTGLAVAGALAFVVAQRRGFGLLERALGRGWTAKTAAAAAGRGEFRVTPDRLDRQCRRNLARAEADGGGTQLWGGRGDRELALCDPFAGVHGAERARRAGRGLCRARHELRPGPRDHPCVVIAQTGAGFRDRPAGLGRLSPGRNRPAVAGCRRAAGVRGCGAKTPADAAGVLTAPPGGEGGSIVQENRPTNATMPFSNYPRSAPVATNIPLINHDFRRSARV